MCLLNRRRLSLRDVYDAMSVRTWRSEAEGSRRPLQGPESVGTFGTTEPAALAPGRDALARGTKDPPARCPPGRGWGMPVTAAIEAPAPADVLLADGSIAVIRPLRPGDGPALHELHEQVSDEAIRMRFFSVARHAAHAYVDHVLADPERWRWSPSGTAGWSGSPPPSRSTPTRSRGGLPRRRRGARPGRGDAAARARGRPGAGPRDHRARGGRAHREPRDAGVFSDAGYTNQRTFDIGTVVLTSAPARRTSRRNARTTGSSGPRPGRCSRCCGPPRSPWSVPAPTAPGSARPCSARSSTPASRAVWWPSTRAPRSSRACRRTPRCSTLVAISTWSSSACPPGGPGRVPGRRRGRRPRRGRRVVGVRRARRRRRPDPARPRHARAGPRRAGWSDRTASGCCATTRTYASTRPSTAPCRPPAASPSPASPAASASSSWTSLASSASACTPSSRWATRPTSPATTCSRPGTTTPT